MVRIGCGTEDVGGVAECWFGRKEDICGVSSAHAIRCTGGRVVPEHEHP